MNTTSDCELKEGCELPPARLPPAPLHGEIVTLSDALIRYQVTIACFEEAARAITLTKHARASAESACYKIALALESSRVTRTAIHEMWIATEPERDAAARAGSRLDVEAAVRAGEIMVTEHQPDARLSRMLSSFQRLVCMTNGFFATPVFITNRATQMLHDLFVDYEYALERVSLSL